MKRLIKFILPMLLVSIVSILSISSYSCLTVNTTIKTTIENYFVPVEKTADIAFKFSLFVRAINTEPDNLFLQNERNFKLYKLYKNNQAVFFYDKLPLGEYRLGYWTATSTEYKTHFRIFAFSNFVYDISKSGKYNLGAFTVNCNVDSLHPKKTSVKYTLLNLPQNEYINYRQILPKKNRPPLEKTILFKKLGYGEVLELINLDDNRVEDSLFDGVSYLKYRTHKLLKAADAEFKQKGLQAALDLLRVFNLDEPNINFLTKKASLYQLNGNEKEAENTFEQIKQIDPNSPEYYSYVGEKKYNSGDMEGAKEALYWAISLNTPVAGSYDLYAKMLLGQDKDISTALALSDFSLHITPNNIKYLETNLAINKKLGDKRRIAKLHKVIAKIK